jgi:hypothetical protein
MSKAAIVFVMVLALAATARAQVGRGDPIGNINMTLLQSQLGVTDDEWQALVPKVQRVVDDLLQLRSPRARISSSAGGDTRMSTLTTSPDSPVTAALADLQATLRDPNATVDDIQDKEQALRDATLHVNITVSGPDGPVTTALADLVTALDDPTATSDELDAKVKALRNARAKAQQDLAIAQEDLISLLTKKQETTLVALGLLD